MGSDDLCNSDLVLGLGFSSSSTAETKPSKIKPTASAHYHLAGKDNSCEPSLTLSLSGDPISDFPAKKISSDQQSADLYRQDSSSFSNVSVKREREIGSEEVDRVSSRISDEVEADDGSNGRKKLRLTKAQSTLLEESFKEHSTLNPKQKQDLARKLKLRPRQVEVWFQNRRARTKLKQTEVDCEFLKKCCETLKDENRRLQKELQELKSAQPLYMKLPAATLTMCPSCEKIGGGGGGGGLAETSTMSPFVMAPKPHFYNPFTNQSAACQLYN